MSLSGYKSADIKNKATDLNRNGIVRIELPLPYNPGFINIYVLTGRQPVLIDTGLEESIPLNKIKEALSLQGVRLDEIEHVFLTHGHADHAGAAAFLARNYGTTIWVHALEKPRLDGRHAHFVTNLVPELFKRLGVDQEALENAAETMHSFAETYLRMRLNGFQTFSHGQKLPVKGYDLHVIHTPGHSPGSVCFFEKTQKLLFTGDTLLSHGTPQPTLGLDRHGGPYFDGFTDLKKSIASLRTIETDLVLPGHGPMVGLANLVSKANAALERKRTLLLKKFTTDFTPYDLIRRRDKRTKSAYLLIDLYLTRAILEALLEEGKVTMDAQDGVEHFFPVR
ncbi:MAG: MBL fold metallo-hydrolase [Deltaproteobacteria bacterium]|nr:MBL fold metallo-hydrolase [Deltaproteobacteria bacterium]MBW2139888.1 MBL fold metallo-hydrolase [Deltaproteobacteria bacterium]